MNKNFIVLILLLFVSCDSGKQVALKILSCVNTEGAIIREDIELIVNGRYVSCDSNNELTLWFNKVNKPIDIMVSSNSDNYIMLSEKNYKMDPEKGLDLTLMFEKSKVLLSSNSGVMNSYNASFSRDEELLDFMAQTQVQGIDDIFTNSDSLLAALELYGDTELINMIEEEEFLPTEYELLIETISKIVSEVQPSDENQTSSDITPAEPLEVEVVTTADITFNVEPDDAIINLISVDSNNRDSFTGSTTVNLLEGGYRYNVSKTDYIQESGFITVVAGNSSSISISLEPRVIVPATISLVISPNESEITFTELNTGQVLSYSASQNSTLSLPPGSYKYSITAQGFDSFENNITFDEAGNYTLMETLKSISITSFIEEANQIEGIREAVQLYSKMNISTLPQVQRITKIGFIDSMIPVAKIMNNGGESLMAEQLYEELYGYMPSHIQLRQSYGRLLIDVSKFDKAISILRPIYGNLINSVNPEQRDAVSFEARYWTAYSAYQKFRSTPDTEPVDKENFANAAYAYLMDVTSRFEANKASLESMEDYYNKAVTYLKLINVN